MKKHPSAFKVCGRLVALVESVKDSPVTLYEGNAHFSEVQAVAINIVLLRNPLCLGLGELPWSVHAEVYRLQSQHCMQSPRNDPPIKEQPNSHRVSSGTHIHILFLPPRRGQPFNRDCFTKCPL